MLRAWSAYAHNRLQNGTERLTNLLQAGVVINRAEPYAFASDLLTLPPNFSASDLKAGMSKLVLGLSGLLVFALLVVGSGGEALSIASVATSRQRRCRRSLLPIDCCFRPTSKPYSAMMQASGNFRPPRRLSSSQLSLLSEDKANSVPEARHL